MTDPLARNRLDDAESPYLRQHADNLVHWQPWDDAAREAARARDRPIFLSIGYAACHWCHVMAEESFEDDRVAERLNDDFVPIKVDREQRPALDRIYQAVATRVAGRGGWPLSVWTTPDGRPFHVATYVPLESRGRSPGFLDLLDRLDDAWATDRETIESRADRFEAAATGALGEAAGEAAAPAQPADPPTEALRAAADAAVDRADREHGGFGDAPKFPQPRRIRLCYRAAMRTGEAAYREVATEALDALIRGGIDDHVGGGFHRYATDREWIVPHFEKMAYDNAEIPRALVTGYRVTGREAFATGVEETIAFLDRELRHSDGTYYSSLSARSDGQEGAFYTWTPDEIAAAVERAGLDAATSDLLCARFGIDGRGEAGTVLAVDRSIDDLAGADRDPEAVRAAIDRGLDALRSARADRTRPDRDEKRLAGWNGLLISMLAEAGLAIDASYADRAADALDAARALFVDGDRVHRRARGDTVGLPGTLTDYAALGQAAFDVHQATGDVDALALAVDLGAAICERFHEDGRLFLTADSATPLVRAQERADRSTPAATGLAVDLLGALDPFVPDDRFGRVVERVLETHADRIRADPLQHATLVLAADRVTAGGTELTMAGDPPATWRERLGAAALPARTITQRTAAADDLDDDLATLGIDDTPPIWAGRDARDGPTLYACRDRTCSAPLDDPDAALDWFDIGRPAE
ncbi:thioredoxin domain-containing protein [Halococcoides cellulosivorans]|uniref:Thioredoxin domain-containing protein n=1 Tax=Halococcoides cellulosivorans TaxID=1679096 RepID=A0A2R4X4B3_9EURY|nr:thioredoxin domain-containing protein [Halococcoides cellulosivorans]AWB28629.1 thioredoxin domain-containing protein [Halococcoides cellulosivorans]